MPLIRLPVLAPPARRRLANGAPRCRGGVSSLLRVGQPARPFAPAARARGERNTAPFPIVGVDE